MLDAGPRLLVLLTNVRDPGNAGTVIRGADAAGADAVLVSEASVDVHSLEGRALHRRVAVPPAGRDRPRRGGDAGDCGRTASARMPRTVRARRSCRTPTSRSALLGHGQRGMGVDEEVRDACDDVVRVPIHGRAESLNLAMAATVCLYASAGQQRRGPAPPGSVPAMPQPFRVPDDLVVNGLEFMPDGLLAAIGDDRIVRFMNSTAERITGLSAAEVVGRDICEAMPLQDLEGPRGGSSPTPGTAWSPARGTASGCSCCRRGASCSSRRSTCARGRASPCGRWSSACATPRRGVGRRTRPRRCSRPSPTSSGPPSPGSRASPSTLLRNWDRLTDDQKRLMLETIEADADRVTRLITELLDASRINTGRLTVHAQPLDVRPRLTAQVARRVAAGAEAEAGSSSTSPTTWVPSGPTPTGSSRWSTTSSRTP